MSRFSKPAPPKAAPRSVPVQAAESKPQMWISPTMYAQPGPGAAPISTMILAGYIFLLTSLLHEYIAAYGRVQFPFVAVSFGFVLLPYLLGGHQFRFLETKFAIPWIALILWWMVAGALGYYRRQSFDYLIPYAIRLHVLPLIFCALARDAKAVRRLLYAAGFGLLVVLGACAKWGQMSEDRFIIPETRLSNSNDLALHLLLTGSLFLIFWSGGRLKRLVLVLGLAATIYFVLKTGSRGNLVTFLVMGTACFWLIPGVKKKAMLIVASVAVLLISLPFVPAQTIHRLLTFYSVDADTDDQHVRDLGQNAVDSTNARLQLQKRAIQLTMQHPLLGVGPLNFADAVEDMVRSGEHVKSGWQVSHNSYLQVSSETGIPGLILYAWSIGLCLALNFRNFRRTRGPDALVSFAIFLAALSYAVGILFCSIAYDYYLSLLVGLTAANELVVRQARRAPGAPRATPGIMVAASGYPASLNRRS